MLKVKKKSVSYRECKYIILIILQAVENELMDNKRPFTIFKIEMDTLIQPLLIF